MLTLTEALETRLDSPRVAFSYKNISFNYSQLNKAVDQLAAQLAEQFDARSTMLIRLPNCPELLILYLAAFKAEIVPMPIYAASTGTEIARIAQQTGCTNLVCASNSELVPVAGIQNIWTIEQFRIKQIYTSGSDSGAMGSRVAPKTTSLILHTSGTSATPKAVLISENALNHIIAGRISSARITEGSVAVVASSLAHSVGLYQCLAYLQNNARFELLDDYEPDRLCGVLNRVKPTHLIMVVGAFEKLLQEAAVTHESFSRIEFASVGADKVSRNVQERFRQCTGKLLSSSYGLTELSWIMVNDAGLKDKALSLGKPAPGVEARLVDEIGNEVERGVTGEIVASSPKLMQGYWESGEVADASVSDGWISTGDLAYQDEKGFYWFVDRIKDVIVLPSGDNVSPQEVEQFIMQMDGVASCVVAGIPKRNPTTGEHQESPQAFIIKSDPDLLEDDIRLYLENCLSSFKIPTAYHFVEQIPLGRSGKISRKAMRERYLENRTSG